MGYQLRTIVLHRSVLVWPIDQSALSVRIRISPPTITTDALDGSLRTLTATTSRLCLFGRNTVVEPDLDNRNINPLPSCVMLDQVLPPTLPRRIASFDSTTGELLWVCGGAAPLAYASPMESGGIVVGLGGYRGASLAVRAAGAGNITESQRLWPYQRAAAGWVPASSKTVCFTPPTWAAC